MKVQGNRYINNPEMIKNKVEKKTTVPQNIISEDDVKISDSARKLVETPRNKVSDFNTMHYSSINGEIREIPAEYKCENLFKLDLKATSISGEQSAFEGCSENQSDFFEKWLDENTSEYLTEDEMKDLKEKINTMTADMDSLNAKEDKWDKEAACQVSLLSEEGDTALVQVQLIDKNGIRCQMCIRDRVKGSTSNRLVIGIWDLPIAVCCLSLPVETILPLLLGWAV